jgi:alpha-mannosidase
MVVTPTRMENAFYSLRLDEHGQITSIYDRREQREVLAEGRKGNVLQAFEDKPMAFDAWDIDIYYQEKMREVTELVEAMVEEGGPLRGTLRLTWRYYDSTIVQRVRIYAYSARIDFDTQVDWHEQQVLLKAAFPVNVRATKATYEIQFGSVERPTHWNTSWDWARFEVSGHKWADLSEGNYGAALLNDCKYGYDIKDGVMRLTLIKSAIRPDALADKGYHAFTYSLLPHAGDWREGDVTREGYALNTPLIAYPSLTGLLTYKAGLPPAFELVNLASDHIILETVKKAEDGDGWVLRLYEYQQKRQQGVCLELGRPIRRAVECDLMEENQQPVQWTADSLSFDIEPFEIKTFMVWFEPET